MKLNRREFLIGGVSALPALFLPKIGHGELPVETLLQDTVTINGVVFENATAKEVFEHGDYYLHVKIPGSHYMHCARLDRSLGHNHTKIIPGKHYVEIDRQDTGQKKYTCVYTGFSHMPIGRLTTDSTPEVRLYFLLESLTETFVEYPGACLCISYDMKRQWRKDWGIG